MADFQELGIKLEAVDNASAKLQKVVDLLEKIKKLSGGGTTTTGSGSTSGITRQATALRSVASIYGKLKVAAEGATNAEIALINAQNRQIASAARYQDAQNKTAAAIENVAKAQEKLKAAQSDYDLVYNPSAHNTPEEIARYNELESQGFNQVKAAQQLQAAKNGVAAAQNAVVTATQQERSAYAALISAQNGVASATNTVKKEQEKLAKQNQKTSKSTVKTLVSLAGAVAVVRRLSRSLFSAVSASGEFVENLNLFAVTFGDNYQETLDWALDFAKNLGVASSEIVRFTGLFKQLADSIGVANEIGDEMSQTLTQLGYDLASFYNISTESAFEKLQAGIFSGQTKPLRSLGLDVTAQTLDNLLKTNEAFKNLGVTSSKALLQSDKAMLRLIAVLQGAQNSFGDMQRTINTLSNQIKVFQGSLANFKLAIGDLFSEPFRQALVYINAFIIALTDIIRLFKPIKTASETAGAGMEQFADDTEDAVDASTGGGNLDFDEFRVLGDSDSQISITEAITTELQKQIDAYNEQLSAMNDVKNEAIEIAEKIKDWFVVLDEEGNFEKWTDNVELLISALKALISLKVAQFFSGIILSITNAISAENRLIKVSNLLRTTGLFLLIYSITELITNWDNLSTTLRVFYVLLAVVGAALVVFSNKTLLSTLAKAITKTIPIINKWTKSFSGARLSILMLGAIIGVGLFSVLKTVFDSMEGKEKVIIGVAVALAGVALAIGAIVAATHGLGAIAVASTILAATGIIAGGIYGIVNGIKGFAEGGITDANFIMTHENGVREWVGKQGNSTAVVNDTQMSTVMSQSVRDGVLEAMSYGTGGNENINITVEAKLDGQKIYESTRRIARKNGEKFAKV